MNDSAKKDNLVEKARDLKRADDNDALRNLGEDLITGLMTQFPIMGGIYSAWLRRGFHDRAKERLYKFLELTAKQVESKVTKEDIAKYFDTEEGKRKFEECFYRVSLDSNKEKVKYYASICSNAIINHDYDDKILYYAEMLSRMQTYHLTILACISQQLKAGMRTNPGVERMLTLPSDHDANEIAKKYRDASKQELYNAAKNDLVAMSLLHRQTTYDGQDPVLTFETFSRLGQQITDLGRDFLKYIESGFSDVDEQE